MLDIHLWVHFAYVSSQCQSIYANSESNTANTQVYVKCKNATQNFKIGLGFTFGEWCRHDENARCSSVSAFTIYINFTVVHSPSQSRRRSRHLTPNPPLLPSASSNHSSSLSDPRHSDRYHHPGVPTLVFLASDSLFVLVESEILYHPRRFILLKQIFLLGGRVVVGGW